jgi:hypothetical protein
MRARLSRRVASIPRAAAPAAMIVVANRSPKESRASEERELSSRMRMIPWRSVSSSSPSARSEAWCGFRSFGGSEPVRSSRAVACSFRRRRRSSSSAERSPATAAAPSARRRSVVFPIAELTRSGASDRRPSAISRTRRIHSASRTLLPPNLRTIIGGSGQSGRGRRTPRH